MDTHVYANRRELQILYFKIKLIVLSIRKCLILYTKTYRRLYCPLWLVTVYKGSSPFSSSLLSLSRIWESVKLSIKSIHFRCAVVISKHSLIIIVFSTKTCQAGLDRLRKWKIENLWVPQMCIPADNVWATL